MQALGVADGLQDGPDGERAVGGDGAGDLEGLVECLTVGDDVADQADLLRLGGRDVPAGEQDVGGDRVGDLTHEPHRRATEWEQAPFCFGHTEFRALAGHPDVGALEDLGAAGDGRPLHRGDERFGEAAALEQRGQPGQVPSSAVALLELVARGGPVHRLEVGARAEGAARAGQDGHPDLRIVVDAVPRLGHDRHHLAGEGVARLGPVHGDDQDRTALLDEAVRSGCRNAGNFRCGGGH